MKTKLTLLLIVVMMWSSFGGASIAQDDDTLNLLFWQAASHLNPYLGNGTKEFITASLTLEPLARWAPDGVTMVPALAEEVPTLDNGGVAADSTSITWNLKEGIVWSDGTPFTRR